jgi:Spy/CpxP family protein refolding chaperone
MRRIQTVLATAALSTLALAGLAAVPMTVARAAATVTNPGFSANGGHHLAHRLDHLLRQWHRQRLLLGEDVHQP